jgi:hypothetical protein
MPKLETDPLSTCASDVFPGVVHILVPRRAAVHRLPEQVGEGKLRVLPTAGVCQVLFDEFSEAESLVEFAHQNQAVVGGDAGPLKLDLERGIEGELKES